jgi:serine/threonine protein phosphatase PrpC
MLRRKSKIIWLDKLCRRGQAVYAVDMTHPRIRLTGTAVTHTGWVRTHNEDAFLLGEPCCFPDQTGPFTLAGSLGYPWLCAVSDGMGAHNAGEVASRIVVQEMAAQAELTPEGIFSCLQALNLFLCRAGVENREWLGMGVTVAGLFCGPEGLYVFNVGDSRVYQTFEKELYQLTEDDSLAALLTRIGQLPAHSARLAGLNSLTQAIGGHESPSKIQPHIHPVSGPLPCRFLLCTDGLTDMVAPALLASLVCVDAQPESVASSLVKAALEAGGADNITVIVADLDEQNS